ncbi:MAG: hypothetical protein M0Q44_02895 [Methylobacter sp.]|nr:hypothetical protein [Methylobacter sp.]
MQRQDRRNPFSAETTGDHLLARTVDPPPQSRPLTRQYAILDMKDIDLGYAGSFDASHPIHRQLARLDAGFQLNVEQSNGKVVLKDGDRPVAVLSKQAARLWSAKTDFIESATVLAMIRRYRDDSEDSYQSRCKAEQWELPLVEIVFDDSPIKQRFPESFC